MLSLILIGISVFLSWVLGLSFIQMKKSAVCFNSAIMSVLSVIACWLIRQAGLNFIVPAVILAIYIAETLSVQLQLRSSYDNSVIAFLLSFSAFCAFVPMCRLSEASLKLLLISGVLFVLFAVLCFLLCKYFPGRTWQDYFASGRQEENRLNIRRTHIYSVAAAVCGGNSALLALSPSSVLQATVISICAFLLLWSGVLLIILMTYYKKERLTVLLERQYREETEAFMNVIRSQRHDYNFHVQTIAGLISGDKIEECRAYVKALEKDSTEMNVLMPIKDPAVSATVFSFRRLAIREGINLHIDIEYDLSKLATNVYETNKILANLLQNAIDEVSTHSDKSYGIRLTTLKRGEYCVIRVSNKLRDIPSAEHLGKLYDRGYTTKKGHEGVGLSSICLLASRYKGIVYAQTEDDIIHFIAKIPINTSKQEEF
ncbi:MAG: GHKL domain-containing protein [Oscillospiraceae bacterium]|nr:GHKL domain-containing protein [Oscillospiraceae bacterium]